MAATFVTWIRREWEHRCIAAGESVFVSLNNPLNPVSVQILDADSVQWFPEGSPSEAAVRDGGTFTSGELTYFNNQDDRTITASFSIDCP